MNKLDSPTIIAVVALLTGLGLIFQMLLSPVKKDIARLEHGQAEIKASQESFRKEVLAKLSEMSKSINSK